ncbi:DUF1294 domain-containing protein [Paenibacillus whitsoniae]|uniref:DUF1294 domain-containing protein n=1 Tax=Paenibacillus whitsoniae TaxID=2496558 RepID=A0A430JC84_9BACL|nr:DUF1294 domain-containing protein [Paenibacillus whitsoniae]RTE08658.1 DUF1294 domain-containing protein [Paenibacillus whitsoniae]
MTLFLVYLCMMNIMTFVEMGYDKGQAKKGERRVPEKRLFWFAALGGAIGGWLGMKVFRHKTKHTSFVVGMPLLVAFNCIVVIVIAMYM